MIQSVVKFKKNWIVSTLRIKKKQVTEVIKVAREFLKEFPLNQQEEKLEEVQEETINFIECLTVTLKHIKPADKVVKDNG